VYAEELIALKEQNDELKSKIALDEGAKTLAELVAPYSRKTQNIIISLVRPGDAEAVTEQFYDIIENLEAINEEDKDEDETMEDEGDTEDKAEDKDEDKKPKKADFEDEAEFKKALKAWEKKHEKDETDKEETEEDDEADEEVKTESTVDSGVKGLDEDVKGSGNAFRDRIKGLTK
jgi:rubrerythrin